MTSAGDLVYEWHLVENGMSAVTRRDPATRLRWGGLSSEDLELLRWFVGTLGGRVFELHTGVPCGWVARGPGITGNPDMERIADTSHPLRVDAMVRLASGWLLVEVKPAAGYQALGQLLSYRMVIEAGNPGVVPVTLVVVTDQVETGFGPIYEAHDVTVVEQVDRAAGQRP